MNCRVNNAGGVFEGFSKDGIEIHIAVNHLAHMYLTLLLLPILEKSKARVINVSSMLHWTSSYPDWPNLALREPSQFSGYGTSKLANILFTRKLGDILKGRGVTVVAVHPGYSLTPALSRPKGLIGFLSHNSGRLLATNQEVGALAQIYAASSKNLDKGEWHKVLIGPFVLLPGFPQNSYWSFMHPYANDQHADSLWQWSLETLKLKRGYEAKI